MFTKAMNDPHIIVPIVIAVAVVAVFIIIRNRITRFRGEFGKGGVKVDLGAAEPDVPPATGVNLTGAQFKDKNTFEADSEARVKASNLQVGSENKFRFGVGTKPTQGEKPNS
jgi:hypothetical protein